MSAQPLVFVTGNANKLKEVRAILAQGHPLALESRDIDLPEIQGSTQDVAREKSRRAAEIVRPFPSVFSSYAKVEDNAYSSDDLEKWSPRCVVCVGRRPVHHRRHRALVLDGRSRGRSRCENSHAFQVGRLCSVGWLGV
ncbi:hypothetical protein OF83DRAFT_1286650 [Amylostereum chailletii]|nr:hypothetical protein OF83DRAFT_1286650 [Amylostereum chailletii]